MLKKKNTSPSSRRAWIEICCAGWPVSLRHVALLAEGVDRNFQLVPNGAEGGSRPPRGGRG